MNKYTLIGGKLGHSLSPQIHERLFALKGRQAEYSLTEISEEELKAGRSRLETFAGLNVTIPHKLKVMPLLDRLDRSAELYGAVNCIDNEGGVLTGYNTDCDGFLESVRAMGASLSGNVLLIGCGGVGRMIAIASALAGAALTVQVIEPDIPLAEKTAADIK